MEVENDYVRLSVNNDEDQPQKPQRRSLWRHWKMLSRFQRNLVTLALVVGAVTLVYWWGLREQAELQRKRDDLLDLQMQQPLPQQADLRTDEQSRRSWIDQGVQFIPPVDWSIVNRPDIKPMHEWQQAQEEDIRYKEKRRWEEEKKKLDQKQKDERLKKQQKQAADTKKKTDEIVREEEKRQLEKIREEHRQIEKELVYARLADRVKVANEVIDDEWKDLMKLKKERREEDKKILKEEEERRARGITWSDEMENSLIEVVMESEAAPEAEETSTLSPEEVEEVALEIQRKEEEERARLEEERRLEQEERIRQEQRRREEERVRELERRRKEEEKRKQEQLQKELDKIREEERKKQEIARAEANKREEEKRRELARMTMVADSGNINEFRLKPVEFPPPRNERQQAVVAMLRHAWAGYKAYAWGHDNLKPISKEYYDWFGLGLTIVDGLDTLWIMGLKQEFNESRDWVATRLSVSFNEFHDVNLFEVTIRVLGGLLSAYHLSGEPVFLERAMGMGERLLPCFTKSPSSIPYSDVNLASRIAHSPKWSPDSSTSEVTTLQLEFRDLSRCCHDYIYEDTAFQVSEHVHVLEKTDGLVPIFINPNTGNFHENTEIKLGARGDSYYEYLLKQWIQTGKTKDFLKEDYLKAVNGIKKRLVKRTPQLNLAFIGELRGNDREFVPKMDHLVCFVPGMLALGVHHGLPEDHLDLAKDLMDTCYRTYSDRPTFLAPEITFFNYKKSADETTKDLYVKTNDAHNLLRPEFIESLWYMWVVTGNSTYQDWGWQIFKAFERYTKVEFGYTSIGNVNNPLDTRPKDMMESFFVSETIKYLYLLFSGDRKLIDIDKWIMNTEGHPLPIYSS